MFSNFSPFNLLHYFLRREANQFFFSIAIRSLAIGMILIYEPIYLYSYFKGNLSLTILFFAALYGLHALLVVFGAKLMARIGLRHSILLSHFFNFSYYLSLFFLYKSVFFVPLSIILGAFATSLFWPAFHTDFVRFSEKGYQGRAVGKMNVAFFTPAIISPVIGGAIISIAGYPALFIAVLLTLFISSMPMFLSKETHIVYSDSYFKAWARIFKRSNVKMSLAFASESLELSIAMYIWPLFLFILAIDYSSIGGIITFALFLSSMFALYMGRMCDTISNRLWFLNIGAILTSTTWIIKYFVKTPFDAFLAHSLYKVSRTSATIPFQSFFYRKVSLKGPEGDEFIIYRDILINISRFFFFSILAVVFFFFPQVNIAFLAAAVISLGFMFLGIPPKFKW